MKLRTGKADRQKSNLRARRSSRSSSRSSTRNEHHERSLETPVSALPRVQAPEFTKGALARTIVHWVLVSIPTASWRCLKTEGSSASIASRSARLHPESGGHRWMGLSAKELSTSSPSLALGCGGDRAGEWCDYPLKFTLAGSGHSLF